MTLTLPAPATGGAVVPATTTDLGGYPVVTIDAHDAGALQWRMTTSTRSITLSPVEVYPDLATAVDAVATVTGIHPDLARDVAEKLTAGVAAGMRACPVPAVLVHRKAGLLRNTIRIEVAR